MEDVAYLIKQNTTGYDDEGNPIVTRSMHQVFCKYGSVTRTEFYQAAEQDLTPELEITISHRIDYEDEKLVFFHDQFYDVMRTYWNGDEVELTLAKSTRTEVLSL